MIIELEKYNKIRGLLIENGTTGSQIQVHYQDRCWRVSVTRVTVSMGVEEMGMQTGHRGAIQSASESGMRTGTCKTTVEQAKKY